jgi:hypothetical protein
MNEGWACLRPLKGTLAVSLWLQKSITQRSSKWNQARPSFFLYRDARLLLLTEPDWPLSMSAVSSSGRSSSSLRPSVRPSVRPCLSLSLSPECSCPSCKKGTAAAGKSSFETAVRVTPPLWGGLSPLDRAQEWGRRRRRRTENQEREIRSRAGGGFNAALGGKISTQK